MKRYTLSPKLCRPAWELLSGMRVQAERSDLPPLGFAQARPFFWNVSMPRKSASDRDERLARAISSLEKRARSTPAPISLQAAAEGLSMAFVDYPVAILVERLRKHWQTVGLDWR